MAVAVHRYSPTTDSRHSEQAIARKGPKRNGDETNTDLGDDPGCRTTSVIHPDRIELWFRLLDHYAQANQPC